MDAFSQDFLVRWSLKFLPSPGINNASHLHPFAKETALARMAIFPQNFFLWGNTQENNDQSDKYKILNDKLRVIVNEAKKNQELKASRLAPDVFKLSVSKETNRHELMSNGGDDKYSLNQSIVEEMLLHFLLAVNSKSGSLVYASAYNPYQE